MKALFIAGWFLGIGPEPLFDGQTLAGWSNPYSWGKARVEDGEIRLTADKKFFLVTNREFGDFEFEGEVKVPEGPANSGFMFRCHVEPDKVHGYQAEVDPSERQWAGGLYDEGRRGWLHPLKDDPKARAAFDRAAWNRFRIRCVGDHIQIFVNGVPTTDYRDAMDLFGPIGLQHHGEKGQTYRFRNLRIQSLGRHAWRPLFNGSNLDGWRTLPGGTWSVKEGTIVGEAMSDETRHGQLVLARPLGDFTVRLQFKLVQGNSGIYFRAREVATEQNLHGLQAEITPDSGGGALYETGGRRMIAQPPKDTVAKFYKPGAWNTLVISTHADRIVLNVNGTQTVDLLDEDGPSEGLLAIQLHGGEATRIEVKDVEELIQVP
jgi:hypothetical protein